MWCSTVWTSGPSIGTLRQEAHNSLDQGTIPLPNQSEAEGGFSQHSYQGGPQGPPYGEAEANILGPIPEIKFSGQGGYRTLWESPVSQSPQEDVPGSILVHFHQGTTQAST